MSQMSFLPDLAHYLLHNKHIATVRKYPYNNDLTTVPGVGLCNRELIAQVSSKRELERYPQYVSISGFSNLDEWWFKIKQFNRQPGPYYLYLVTLKEQNETQTA